MTNKRHWIYLILMTVALIGLGMFLGQMPAHAAVSTYTVTATVGINGSLDASTPSPATVNSGATTAFKFNASANHYVASVIDTCGGTGYFNSSNSVSSYTYTTPAITAACTVSATFALVSTFSVNCSAVSSTSTTDSDGDGFTDYQECYGIVLSDGTCICGSAGCPSGCTSTNTRTDTLNPNIPDVFVILAPATGGYFQYLTSPPNPLQYVSNPTSQGGLGITIHYISSTQTQACGSKTKPPSSRCVVTLPTPQQAVMVTESLDNTTTNPLGFSNTGTPDGPDLSTVYTQRINTFISTTCGTAAYGTANCADTSGVYDSNTTLAPANCTNCNFCNSANCALTLKYIKHTINHEVAHVLGPLAPVYNANYGGYHYKTGTNVIMDQSIYYTSIGGKVTFYIGTTYTGPDEAGVKFHP